MLLYMVIHKSSTENQLDVQFDVAERAKKDFCGSGMYANTGLGLRGIGEAVWINGCLSGK